MEDAKKELHFIINAIENEKIIKNLLAFTLQYVEYSTQRKTEED